jgi:hypothetical protein
MDHTLFVGRIRCKIILNLVHTCAIVIDLVIMKSRLT